MEALLILISLILIGFAFYSSSASIKYKRALRLFSQKEFNKAQSILVNILNKHPEAVTKYAETFYKLGLQDKDPIYFQKTIDCKKYLNSNSNKKSYELIEAAAVYELALSKYLKFINDISLTSIHNLENNLLYISTSVQTGKEDEIRELVKQHYTSIALIHYKMGIYEEKKNKYTEAIDHYNKVRSKIEHTGPIPTYYNACFRKNICLFKMDNEVSSSEMEELENINHPFNQELYYRYCIQLLQKSNIDNAEKYIKRVTIKNDQVAKLNEAIKYFRNKNLTEDLENINGSIERLYGANHSHIGLEELYENVVRVSKTTQFTVPDVYQQLFAIRPSLLNRVLFILYEKSNYDKIIELITDYPEFYKNPLLLKNLGNACFNYMNEGLVNETNYKLIVSSFLTSVFSDQVILASIENTEWDDDYTFTLIDSLGFDQGQDNLPLNVNYDEINDTNISIGEVQRELLRLFEGTIKQNISNIRLKQIIENFYNSEKEALENIIYFLSKDTIISSPYFAKMYKINEDILNDIEEDYLEYDSEFALEIGTRYLSNNENEVISKYNNAKHLINRIVESIKNNDFQELKNMEPQFKTIICFNSLGLQLEEEIVKAFHEEINKDNLNEDLVKYYKVILNVFAFSDKLKYQYGNFITSLCMIKVFEKKVLTNLKALKYLTDAYLKTPDNFNVCKSLVLFINNNLFDIINEESYESNKIFEVLNLINNHKSDVFIQNAILLEEARARLASQLPREFWTAAKNLTINDRGLQILSCLRQMQQLSRRG